MTSEDVAALFGKSDGFKAAEPNVTTTTTEDDVEF